LCGGTATLLMALNRFTFILYFIVINHDNNSVVLISTI
jgi:hypothetical protein